jgi:hypothetical protein
MWDLWWTKWHWDRFFSEFFRFPLSMYHSTVALQTHIIWGMRQYASIKAGIHAWVWPTPPSGKKKNCTIASNGRTTLNYKTGSYFGSLFYDAFSVTRPYIVDDIVISKWWWRDEDMTFEGFESTASVSKRSRPVPQTERPLGPAGRYRRRQFWPIGIYLYRWWLLAWQSFFKMALTL